ncbi:MAG: hypothetical protein KC592_05515 [Nitrospira sp.]|nr:hypothetical protein [Nitrospira sp.]
MTSNAQLFANRTNGAKSHGPSTDEGKGLAKFNAMAHGLRSQHVLLPNEDPSGFESFQEGMRADLQPEGSLEGFLFGQLVGYAWRLRRCQGIEVSLLSLAMGQEKVDRAYEKARSCYDGYSPQSLPDGGILSETMFNEAANEEAEGRTERDHPTTVLGAGFSRGESGFRLLSRYETSLTRNLTRNLGLFFEAQRTRLRRLKDVALDE